MKINVAGAGAGKTTSMAAYIKDCSVPEGKVLFCIAFTNAAVENIKNKVVEEYGCVPSYIRISTIHSFLYQELIQPYYFFLYETHYKGISVIDLPTKDGYRNKTIRELKKKGYLHQTKIPETAKWVVDKKSNDRTNIKVNRQSVLNSFSSYCYKVLLDEAQDIDKDMKAVLVALDNAGVDIELFGDPKQDIRGHNEFRALIDSESNVNYMCECHRCPQKHLQVSNLLAQDKEKQVADEDAKPGTVHLYFESEIDNAAEFIEKGRYGLKYIHQRNDRFDTHSIDALDKRFETLNHELSIAIREKWSAEKSELAINRAAYYLTEKMLKDYDAGDQNGTIINQWIKNGLFNYDSVTYAKICQAMGGRRSEASNNIVVDSIAAVKGLEAEMCLFILTRELAPYLFGEKTEEKATKHLLYVALTRSRNDLSILVAKEVEDRYSKEFIRSYLMNVTEIEV